MQDHDNPRSFNQDLGRNQRVHKKEREGAASCRKSEFINSLHMVYIILVFLKRVSFRPPQKDNSRFNSPIHLQFNVFLLLSLPLYMDRL